MALKLCNVPVATAFIESTKEMVSQQSWCIHVSDIGDTTWNDISRRQQVCIMYI